jgi:hypothetical protein
LQPALFTNTQTFYSPQISIRQAIEPALYTNSQTFFSPNVTTGLPYVLKYWNGTAWQTLFKNPTVYA